MPTSDERNVLHIGPPQRASDPEITSAMADSVSARIREAGGVLTVWAILHEDLYETRYGDGFYLHVRGIAFNSADAQRLIGLAGNSEWSRWHIKGYQFGLENSLPALMRPWPKEEEFTIGDFVAILAEIPQGGTTSKLLIGTGLRKDGPFITIPEK